MTLVSFLVAGSNLSAQVVVQITEDKVYNETVVFNEDTILEGVGMPNVVFNGTPKMKVNNCRVMLKNMRIADRNEWGTIKGEDACLEWTGIGMHGFIQDGDSHYEYMLDGVTKR